MGGPMTTLDYVARAVLIVLLLWAAIALQDRNKDECDKEAFR
jgi:hypothetical protein